MEEKDFKQAMKWYRRAPVTRVAPETGSLSAQPKKDVSQREKARVWFPRDLPACSSPTETDEKYEETSDNNHSALTVYREKPVAAHGRTEKVEAAEAFNAPEIPLAETMSEDNPPYDVDYRTIRDDEELLLGMPDEHATKEETKPDRAETFSGMLASIETGLANMLAEKPRFRHPPKNFSQMETGLTDALAKPVSEETVEETVVQTPEKIRQRDIDAEIAAELATLSEEELAEIAGFDLSLLRKDDESERNEIKDEALSDMVVSAETMADEESAAENITDEETGAPAFEEETDLQEEVLLAGEDQPEIEEKSETILSDTTETDVSVGTLTEDVSDSETVIAPVEEDTVGQKETDVVRIDRFIDSGEGLIIQNLSATDELESVSIAEDSFSTQDDDVVPDPSEGVHEESISLEEGEPPEINDITESVSEQTDLLSDSHETMKEMHDEDLLAEEIDMQTLSVSHDEDEFSDEDVTDISGQGQSDEIADQKNELKENLDGLLSVISFEEAPALSESLSSEETEKTDDGKDTVLKELEFNADLEESPDLNEDLPASENETTDRFALTADEIPEFDISSEEADKEVLEKEETAGETDTGILASTVIKEVEEENTPVDELQFRTETIATDDGISPDEEEITLLPDEKAESEMLMSDEIFSDENEMQIELSDLGIETEVFGADKISKAGIQLDDEIELIHVSGKTDEIAEILPVLSTDFEEDESPKTDGQLEVTIAPDPENALADGILLAEGENPPDFDVPVVPAADEMTEKDKAPIPEEDVFREKILSHQRNKMAFAEYKVAVAYARKNTEEANREMVRWYTRAAENGHAVSQFNLGNIYYAGRGVEQDYELAADWYEMAAKQGVARAQDNLGLMYFHGRGRFVDTELAVYWFHQAALQGYAPAQYKLAMHLEAGVGTDPDLKEAMLWYQKAAGQGDINAKKAISRLKGNHE